MFYTWLYFYLLSQDLHDRQRLSQPILWIVAVCATYWTHTAAVYVLIVALTRLRLPTHPRHPTPTHPRHPTPTHPLIHAICM